MHTISTLPTPDSYVWKLGPAISGVRIENNSVKVYWSDGQSSVFHAMWLRDNCACDQCVHPFTREQRIDLLDIPDNIAPLTASIDDSGGLFVSWNHDNHSSLFNPGWLFAHSGLADNCTQEKVLWTSAEMAEPPTFDGPAVMVDDEALYQVLETVLIYGVARLRGLPAVPNSVEKFALRIGPIRETHFERIFNVLSRPDADSNAYTSDELSAHMDIPTREFPPGLQMLHCISAEATGGESVMIDGFRVAEDMRCMHPEAFENLATVKWTYANRAGDLDYRWDTPHLILDENDQLVDIRLASFSRAPLIADIDIVEKSYRALRIFLKMTYEDQYRMVFPFVSGDLVIFDNRRILHARKSFDPSSGKRHLQGTYVDRDDHLAMMRTVQHRRNRRKVELLERS